MRQKAGEEPGNEASLLHGYTSMYIFVPKMWGLTVIWSGNIYYSTSVLECTL